MRGQRGRGVFLESVQSANIPQVAKLQRHMVMLFRIRQGPVLPVNQLIIAVFELERVRHRESESVLILIREWH